MSGMRMLPTRQITANHFACLSDSFSRCILDPLRRSAVVLSASSSNGFSEIKYTLIRSKLGRVRDDAAVVMDSGSTDEAMPRAKQIRLGVTETRESLMRGYGDVLDDKAIEATTVFDRIRAQLRRALVHRL